MQKGDLLRCTECGYRFEDDDVPVCPKCGSESYVGPDTGLNEDEELEYYKTFYIDELEEDEEDDE